MALLIINLSESPRPVEVADTRDGDYFYDRLRDAIRNDDNDTVRALYRQINPRQYGPGIGRMNKLMRERTGCEYVIVGRHDSGDAGAVSGVMLTETEMSAIVEQWRLMAENKPVGVEA